MSAPHAVRPPSENEVTLWLRAEGLVAMGAGVAAYALLGESWWLFAALFLVPDLAMIGNLAGPKSGARIYNAAHTTLLPATLVVIGAAAAWPMLYAIAAIILAHIGFDRALGFGLKRTEGFAFTHLGPIGKRR